MTPLNLKPRPTRFRFHLWAASLALLTSGAMTELNPNSAQRSAANASITAAAEPLAASPEQSHSTPAAPLTTPSATPLSTSLSASLSTSLPTSLPTSLTVQRADLLPELPLWLWLIGGTLVVAISLPKIGWIAGLIVIGEREVGIVTKKFAAKSLPAGRLLALNGEAGLQADTLPPGWHFGYFPWQYSIKKDGLIVIPQGEIQRWQYHSPRAHPRPNHRL
jgi:hypothetical protein